MNVHNGGFHMQRLVLHVSEAFPTYSGGAIPTSKGEAIPTQSPSSSSPIQFPATFSWFLKLIICLVDFVQDQDHH